MSMFFIAVYPLRHLIVEGVFCQDEVLKLFETNLLWDGISLLVFATVGMAMLMLPQSWVRALPVQAALLGSYLLIGHLIVSTNRMYYSDRAFVVCLCWGFACKIYSYFNAHEKNAKLSEQIVFFFSPCLVYDGFTEGRLPHRPLIFHYVVKKAFLILTFLFANCIIIVEFIDPVLAKSDRMSFVELFFHLIPPVFYLNLSLIYTIFENTFSPLAELTRMSNRRFFEDWWNATNLHEFLEKMSSLTDRFLEVHLSKILGQYFPATVKHLQKIKIAVLLVASDLIALQIFDKQITLAGFTLFFLLNTLVVAFAGRDSPIFNNYLVHSVFICFFPLMIAC